MIMTKEETNTDHVKEPKTRDEIDDEEPEEDPEEHKEVDDANPQLNSSDEKNEEKIDIDAKPEKKAEQVEAGGSTKEEITTKTTSAEPRPGGYTSEKTELKVDSKKEHSINKDLLQAFRFFDRNRVGYIRVEDMRLIIHNLGKFLSHRDVKELVQSALLESNTGKDDHILYNKLVHLSDI